MCVLFFGPTGIDKRTILPHFANWCEAVKTRRCRTIDFETDYLTNRNKGARLKQHQFLDSSQLEQQEAWRRAWTSLCEDIERETRDVFVGLHGCVVRGHYGVRIVAEPSVVASFRPDCVVTLIDDIYEMWSRTEARAHVAYKGRPTLEQLLLARRVELMVADQIAYSHSVGVPIRQIMLSVKHPCETLANWVYALEDRLKIVYLSFPISAPRRLMAQVGNSGLQEINDFIRAAYDWQHERPDRVVLCPLGIDELPLANLVAKCGEEAMNFDPDVRRWNLDTVWRPQERISPTSVPASIRTGFPLKQIEDARGMINTDVGWRDYRLVETANFLAVFNPRYRGAADIARSVRREIDYGTGKGIPAHVYQNPEYDFERFTDRVLFSEPGTMQASPQELRVLRHTSIQDIFYAIKAS